jgi:universal stress protein E
MRDVSKILCVIDPTAADQPAMNRAAWLAKAAQAELELFICSHDELLTGSRFFESASLEKAREKACSQHRCYLQQLAAPLVDIGIDVNISENWDHPLFEGIVRRAIASGSDIVFKDTHHHPAIARALLSNTDWNLIRSCPMPLWLVRNRKLADVPTFLAAVDPLNEHDKPAALDDEILISSIMLAEVTGGSVHAVHSYDPDIALGQAKSKAIMPVSFSRKKLKDKICRLHTKRFRSLMRFHEIPKSHTHLVSGVSHEQLPAVATELHADVVVMGAVARNRLRRVFVGATAERTVDRLPCDLLVIKPAWFHTPVKLSKHDEAA